MSFLLVAGVYVVSGCATTSHDSYTPVYDSSGIEEQQPSPTEDMTGIEKAAYYIGWLSLCALYGWAGGNPTFPP